MMHVPCAAHTSLGCYVYKAVKLHPDFSRKSPNFPYKCFSSGFITVEASAYCSVGCRLVRSQGNCMPWQHVFTPFDENVVIVKESF